MRREEKDKELELEKNIRNLKVQQSRTRRDEPGIMQQPAGKKRRLNKHEL